MLPPIRWNAFLFRCQLNKVQSTASLKNSSRRRKRSKKWMQDCRSRVFFFSMSEVFAHHDVACCCTLHFLHGLRLKPWAPFEFIEKNGQNRVVFHASQNDQENEMMLQNENYSHKNPRPWNRFVVWTTGKKKKTNRFRTKRRPREHRIFKRTQNGSLCKKT